jgi:hypothetical protein
MEEDKRSAGYSLDFDNAEIAISDDRLEPGWYRIISAGETEIFNNKLKKIRLKRLSCSKNW